MEAITREDIILCHSTPLKCAAFFIFCVIMMLASVEQFQWCHFVHAIGTGGQGNPSCSLYLQIVCSQRSGNDDIASSGSFRTSSDAIIMEPAKANHKGNNLCYGDGRRECTPEQRPSLNEHAKSTLNLDPNLKTNWTRSSVVVHHDEHPTYNTV